MLIYIILMLALAYFFQKEGQKLLAGKSKLLAEFCSLTVRGATPVIH